jgi:hypothetical protein
MSRVISPRGVMPAVLAAVAAAATDGAYLGLINSQQATGPNPGVVPFITLYIAAIATAAVVAVALMLRGKPSAAWPLLVSATTASAALGFLAIFSIGLALLITAGLTGSAALRLEQLVPTSRRWQPALVGSFSAIVVLVAGFVVSGVFWGA